MLRGNTADLDGMALADTARWQPQFGDAAIDAVRYVHAPVLDLVTHAETGLAVLMNQGATASGEVTAAARDIGPAMLTLPRGAGGIVDGVIAGCRLPQLRLPAASLSYLPRDADYRLAYGASAGSLNLLFPDGWLDGLLGPEAALSPIARAVDPGVGHVARLIAAEVRHPGPASRLLIEGLGRALAVRLARLDGVAVAAPAERIHLTPLRLRRVTDYVDAHLAADFGLAELAAVADLSPFHFTRVFKRATGQTPWAYVRQRRLELARQLLATSDLPVVTIATRCGYASAARFTTSFTAFAGLSPGRFRRQVREVAA